MYSEPFTRQLICHMRECQSLRRHDLIHDNREFAIFIFGHQCGSQMVSKLTGNRWRRFSILWSDQENWLAGPNLDCLSKRPSVPFARFFVEYMSRARSLDKLSSEWFRTDARGRNPELSGLTVSAFPPLPLHIIPLIILTHCRSKLTFARTYFP